MGVLLLLVSLVCWVVLWSQFPAGFCQCQWSFTGCRCGKKRRKAETRAADIERQERAAAVSEQSRQEILARQLSEQLAEQIGFPEVARRTGLTGEALFREIGPISSQLANIIAQRLAVPPTIPFEETFQPQLALLQDAINREASRRGILGGGVPIERLGRAGVELAVKEASRREQNRLLNEQLRQQTLLEGGTLSEFANQLAQISRGERQTIAPLLTQTTQQGVAQGLEALERGRQRAFEASQTGLGLLSQREQQAAERDRQIAMLAGTAALGGLGAAFAPAAFGMAAGGGFLGGLGRFGTGALQATLGTGAFSPYAGLENLLASSRTAPFQTMTSPTGRRLQPLSISFTGQ